MEPCNSRALTRRRAADAQRQDENVKRIRTISNLISTPSASDIVFENVQVIIKTEPAHIKTEPDSEQICGEIELDVPLVSVKDEMEVHIQEEELIISETENETGTSHGDCSFSDDIYRMKESFEQQIRNRDAELEKMRNEFTIANENRRVEIADLKASFDDQMVDLANKFETITDELGKKLEEKYTFILKLNEGLNEFISNFSGTAAVKKSALSGPTGDRVTKLFPKVLQVMWLKHLKSRVDGKDYINLNCRLACKDWSAGMLQLIMRADGPLDRKIESMVEYSSEQTTVVKNWLKVDTPSPFPPTVLSVSDISKQIKSSTQLAEYRRLLKTFLQRFGNDIKSFHYTIDYIATSNVCSLGDWYSTFRSWIELMPNIQVLTLTEHNKGNDSTELVSRSAFVDLVSSNPVPHLPYLMELHVSRNGFSEYMFLSIIATNNSLENVKWAYTPAPKSSQAELTAYSLMVPLMERVFSESFVFEMTIRTNSSLVIVPWLKAASLQHLHVVVPSISIHDNLVRPDVFKVLESLDNLKSLRIEVPTGWHLPQLHMPGIKKLNLVLSVRIAQVFNMDRKVIRLISSLTTLQELAIDNLHFGDMAWCPKIEGPANILRGCLRRSLKIHFVRKLWNKFPLLKMVRIKSCYRTQYNTLVFIRMA